MLQYMAVSRFNSFLCVRVCLQNGMPQLESTRNCRCWGFSNRSETASERQCPCTLRPQNKANQTMTQYCSHCPIRHESSMSNPMKSHPSCLLQFRVLQGKTLRSQGTQMPLRRLAILGLKAKQRIFLAPGNPQMG